MCALDKRCIAPIGSQLKCNFKGGAYARYANCHRYDQSLLNILLANNYKFDDKTTYSSVIIIKARRSDDVQKAKAVKICNGPEKNSFN